MTNAICLNENYSTTKLLSRDNFILGKRAEDISETILFSPKSKEGGGLRTQGYFKKSYDDKQLVTVITVVYNGEDYLEETILSVINQTYDNVEYIIIDGGSTDGTLEIIKKYENQIDYWLSEQDEGIYDAMNKAATTATGDYINFMNAGDFFNNTDIINSISDSLIEDFVYGNHIIVSEDNTENSYADVKNYSDKRNIPFCHQSLFERRSCLLQHPFNTNYKIAADYDHYLNCIHNGASFKHVPITVSKFLDGGLSMSSRKNLIKEYYQTTKRFYPYSAVSIYIIRLIKFYLLGK